ncbi:MAG: NADP-dependent oxidoreductase [Rubinisphaera brasiliensis]|uniref:NADP-dependent oxidoreductase n=1 Tax=Rubinisphaera brasiliensis TaxID=119 RepID=UPI000C46F020|nr:NADP-dependent oxidoreductase [Planctomyces sp.]
MENGTVTARTIRLKSRPESVPTLDHFELVEEPLPPLDDGQFLVRNAWISVDPYMRGRMRDTESYVPPFELGQPMEGGCVGEVIASQNDKFPAGQYVLGNLGWRDHWISSGEGVTRVDPEAAPLQAYLGVLGMTGMTAYVGLKTIGQLKEGETVFVSAASGAVGSIVCQIAKLKSCHVIGSAGSQKKIDWLLNEAGIDQAFNYHDVDNLTQKLTSLAPEGIDLYFDNVGGDHLEAALNCMNEHGRVVCCGMISGYNDEDPQPGPSNLFKIITKKLRLQGFIVRDHLHEFPTFMQEMSSWIHDGRISWKETVTEGLENAPQAFIDLFSGSKMGKAIVRID